VTSLLRVNSRAPALSASVLATLSASFLVLIIDSDFFVFAEDFVDASVVCLLAQWVCARACGDGRDSVTEADRSLWPGACD
jgi:hypothetical protein